MKEKLLITKAKHGDQGALDELIRLWYQPIYNYLTRKTGNPQIASDLTQETFLKLVESLPRYSFLASFSTYLHTIAYHTAIDYFRKHKEYQVLDERQWENMADSQEQQNPHGEHIKEILGKLPEKQRECILLHYYQGLKYRQIAQILDTPISTVKTRVRIGLQTCRKLWEAEHETTG